MMFDMDQPPFICRWKAIAIVAALTVPAHAFGGGEQLSRFGTVMASLHARVAGVRRVVRLRVRHVLKISVSPSKALNCRTFARSP
jgi:hypothetical protein